MFTRFTHSFFLFFLGIIFLAGCIDTTPTPPPVCVEEWFCDAWSVCSDGLQSRICTEKNNCIDPKFRPPLTQECVVVPVSNDIPATVTMGAEETVFVYDDDSCSKTLPDLDIPDAAAHAVRTPEGEILLSSGSNYFSRGSNFDNLSRSCAPVYQSIDDWDVGAFSPIQWTSSIYSVDGKTVHGLWHNEYHDPFALNCRPGDTQPSNPCWYNFITYARSTNGGKTFAQPAPPGNLVAILPFQWDANSGKYNSRTQKMDPPQPIGYMEPSNIVEKDGFYYAMVRRLSKPLGGDDAGCVMRTNNLNDPSSWKFWNGESFSIPLTNPYPVEPSNPDDFICTAVVLPENGSLNGSLTYNTYFERYMITGAATLNDSTGKLTCGFWYILSNDLIHWGKPTLLRETVLGWPPCNNPTPAQKALSVDQEAYPSVIDHSSTSVSFETADDTVYLYWMQNQDNHGAGGWGIRRNLVRAPVTFHKR